MKQMIDNDIHQFIGDAIHVDFAVGTVRDNHAPPLCPTVRLELAKRERDCSVLPLQSYHSPLHLPLVQSG